MPSSTPDFDSVAAFYDPLARLVFGPTLLRAQRAALQTGLPTAGAAPRVLFIGGGTGRVLPELLAVSPGAQVLYLEASARMLRQAEELARPLPAAAGRVQFRHGTETALLPAEQFDVIVAFFLFDLFPPAELADLLARLQRHAHGGTRWLVADFAPPRRGWQRGLQWLMYRFFGLTSGVRGRQLPDIVGALGQLGLRPAWGQQWADGLVQAGVWQ
ncbi:class I SAM-dependent methyltransferase [Hymenobacter jeollabukensis]|uniref:Class I SAM-dependent methyltransferase n=1 Tax=Hymenobacter jeollabukensis TaxID=2025313 RepID=A0A5R8WKM6_9BACT|nr:class I SAM-dependent methyltransferase [Hymenobacter jeollabukensis]TLM89493.1 class I SAM-dependent methyltransferase [Hymenobacter jeollabukensis]